MSGGAGAWSIHPAIPGGSAMLARSKRSLSPSDLSGYALRKLSRAGLRGISVRACGCQISPGDSVYPASGVDGTGRAIPQVGYAEAVGLLPC